MSELAEQYIDEARRQFRGYKRLGEGALNQLRDDELDFRLDPEALSPALLVKHLAGNMRSRFTDFLTSDGDKPWRHRDQEFELAAPVSRDQVMAWWEEGWDSVFRSLASLAPADLLRTVTIRRQPHTVLQALNRQIAHYAYHIGQLVIIAKHLRGSQWQSLSIPRGQSEQFNAQFIAEQRKRRQGG